MSDFRSIDNAILDNIQEGRHTFQSLYLHPPLRGFADALDAKGDGYRLIDRRLQALRKAGKIHQPGKRGVWNVVQS